MFSVSGRPSATSPGFGDSSNNFSTSARSQAAVPGVISIAAPAAIPNRTDLTSGHPRLESYRDRGNHRVAGPHAAPAWHRNRRKALASCVSQAAHHDDPNDTTTTCARPLSMSSCAAANCSPRCQGPPDAFAQFSHACFKQKHPGGDMLQAAARGVQNQPGAQIPAHVGNPLVKVSGYAWRQAATCHHEFG